MPQKNFLFVPAGSHGDVHPIVGLAIAMKARGHKVAVGTNGHFRALVENNQLEFIELGTEQEYLEATRNPQLWDAREGAKVVMAFIALNLKPNYECLLQLWQREKFTLVASPLCMSARLLQETHGVPLISTHLQPLALRTVYEVPGMPLMPAWAPSWWIRLIYWVADVLVLDPIICPALNAYRQELGLPPVKRVTQSWWNSPQRIIGLWPEWFAALKPDWPAQARLAGFPLYDESNIGSLSPELEAFLAAGSAPIAFTPGSAMRQGREFFEAATGACEKLQRRAVLLTRFAENIPPNLPASVLHVPFAPFSQLLPRCVALVHHGGIGTMAQGFAAGIPQLLMPMSHDQPDNLLRLRRLGAGDGLAPALFKAPAVAEKLQALLTDTRVQTRCRELQARIKADQPLATACELLEAALV
jgi:rhamnosyltransferase subunit B